MNMDESFYLRDAGRDLVDYAHKIPEEDARSRSETLFPFVYLASKKMSSRSISRWLSEEKGIEFSAASVAKLLRESARYFRLITDRVQPLAEHFSAQVGGDPESLLFTPYGAEIAERDARANFEGEEALDYTNRVLSELHEEWFSLDEEIRFRCKPYFDFEPVASDEE